MSASHLIDRFHEKRPILKIQTSVIRKNFLGLYKQFNQLLLTL